MEEFSKKHKNYQKVVDAAKYYEMLYTGTIDEKILFAYRDSESEEEKKQRKRLYIGRSKHVISGIENVLDSLATLDTAAINVTIQSKPDQEKTVYDWIWENNIEQQAYTYVKISSLVDANSVIVAGLDEDGILCFEHIPCSLIIECKIVNDKVKKLVIRYPDEDPTKNDHVKIYTEKEYIYGRIAKQGGTFIPVDKIKVSLCYAIHTGYKLNPFTQYKTYLSILEPASELFRQLIYDGSEYDIIKNCHGIEKTFAFAPVCDYSRKGEEGIEYCRNGDVYMGDQFQKQCPSCQGTGLKIHRSSQNIMYLPEPRDKQEYLALDKLVHTVHIEQGLIDLIKQDLDQLENEIKRTVFNSNTIIKEDIIKTATEVSIDQNGIYSALQQLGRKVSDVFIWMVEVYADINKLKDINVYHGYTMELNMDSVTTMLDNRAKALVSGASYDIVKTFDYAILKKQHMDNPEFINRYSILETLKPFSDKSETERMGIISLLDDNNLDKLLYNYWQDITIQATDENDDFFDLKRDKQKAILYALAAEKVSQIEEKQPERALLDDLGNPIDPKAAPKKEDPKENPIDDPDKPIEEPDTE